MDFIEKLENLLFLSVILVCYYLIELRGRVFVSRNMYLLVCYFFYLVYFIVVIGFYGLLSFLFCKVSYYIYREVNLMKGCKVI